ncbi:MAG: GntR family transcriptional regulator, partial [Proteobacteria bacterium]|nr:GntR family transcriptional regulator [Pseudomonadota bacterium]
MSQETANASQQLFTPVKNKRTFEEVSSNIKELILDGTLKVGDRLPPETQLAQQFNVGR